jgi:hypothetical protein
LQPRDAFFDIYVEVTCVTTAVVYRILSAFPMLYRDVPQKREA